MVGIHKTRVSSKAGKPNLIDSFALDFIAFDGRLHVETGGDTLWDLRQTRPVPYRGRGSTIRRSSSSPVHDVRHGAFPTPFTTDHDGTGYHYPSWGFFQIDGTGIPAAGGTSFHEELAFGRMTTSLLISFNGIGGWSIRLVRAMPSGAFFGPAGIRWANSAHVGDPVVAQRQTISLELMDPATGLPFGTPKKVSRTPTGTEATASWLTLPLSMIEGSVVPGQMIVLVLSGESTDAAAVNTTSSAQIELDLSPDAPAGAGFGEGDFGESDFGE